MEKSQPDAGNPYSAFPAYERVKLEIFDRYLAALDAWDVAAASPTSPTEITAATLKLLKWYTLVYGYNKQRACKELEPLKGIMLVWYKLRDGRMSIDKLIDHERLATYILAASEYMNELGITKILQHHKPDRQHIVSGIAEG